MISPTLTFENSRGERFSLLDHGLKLISFDAPAPKPVLYNETVDGKDGALDLTEWAGIIRFNDRSVSAVVRDKSAKRFRELENFCLGNKLKIFHTMTPDYYYEGRCVSCDTPLLFHNTFTALSFTCFPYRLANIRKAITKAVSENTKFVLYSQRMPVTPEITVTGECTLTFDGSVITLQPGKYTVPNFVITDTPKEMLASGSGTVTLAWQDGVL